MKKGSIILIISIVSLLMFSPLQAKDKEIEVKIAGIKYARESGKDVIQVYLTSNLPEGTILNCQVNTLVFSPDTSVQSKKGEEKFIHSWLIEVGKAGQVRDKIKKFPWDLPPALYIIKVELSDRQRREIIGRLPKEMLRKTLTQKVLVIGSVKDLIETHRDHLSELRKIHTFYEDSLKALTEFIELYNSGKIKGEEKGYTDRLNGLAEQLSKRLDKTIQFSFANYPGFFRVSYKMAMRIGSSLVEQEMGAVGMATGVPSKSRPGMAETPPPGATGKLTLREDTSDSINKAKEDLSKEAVFDLFIILNHCARDMEFTYDKISRLTDRKKLWAKEKTRFQNGLTRFDRYFEDFQNEVSSDEYENISTYRDLLKKLLETYSSLISGEEKEPLEATLKETLEEMRKIFPSR